MRNASDHQGQNECSGKKRKYDIYSIKRVTRKFLKVSRKIIKARTRVKTRARTSSPDSSQDSS